MVSQENARRGSRALLLLLAVAAALLAASGAALAVSKACPKGTTQAKPCSGTQAADKLTGTSGTDYINGLAANDVQIGLLGDDFLRGGAGSDVLVGGTEQFETPNFDTMWGGAGADTNVWAPGDGDDDFRGGAGRDAQVFGVIDIDGRNVPTLSKPVGGFPYGVPTAAVKKSPGFCKVTRAGQQANFDFLVRFFVRETGDLAVTIRLADVEQVFCTSKAGGQITFADLTRSKPRFVNVSRGEVADLNPTVARIVR
jgi:Ca2+-binding RTX toxin-like protein